MLGRIRAVELLAGLFKSPQSLPEAVSSFNDRPTYASITRVPGRDRFVSETINSVYSQFRRIFVVAYDLCELPKYLDRPKVVVVKAKNYTTTPGAKNFSALKFADDGLFFPLVDNIVYPPDYVKRMTLSLEECGFKSVVGVEGHIFPTAPNSARDHRLIRLRQSNKYFLPTSSLNSGCMAFSTNDVRIDPVQLRASSVTDIELASLLKRKGIPSIAIPRRKNWLTHIPEEPNTTRSESDSAASSLIVDNRPWGFQDLFNRSSMIKKSASRAWTTFADFMVTTVERGPRAAIEEFEAIHVEKLPNRWQLIMDFVEIYCDEIEQLTICREIAKLKQIDITRVVSRCGKNYPEAAAEVFSASAEAALNNHDLKKRHEHLFRSIKYYNRAYNIDKAQCLIEYLPASNEVVEWSIRLALAKGDFESVSAKFESRPNDYITPAISYSLALAQTSLRGLDAAIPSLCDLLLSGEFQLILLFAVHVQNLQLELNDLWKEPLRAIEGQLSGDARLTLIKLYLALRDREAAACLLANLSSRIPVSGSERTALEVACQLDFGQMIQRLNADWTAQGLIPVEWSHSLAKRALSNIRGEADHSQSLELVTVVVTTYNASSTVEYSLRSVQNQSHRNLEIIIIDDNSTDETISIVSKIQKNDHRISIVQKVTNEGPYAARNSALKLASGDYITFQDADDYSHPQRVECQLRELKAQKAVACYARHLRITGDGFVALETTGSLAGDGHVTLMFKKKVLTELGGFIPVRTRGDLEFRARLIKYYGEHRVLALDEILLLAHHSPETNSWTTSVDWERRRQLEYFKEHYKSRHLISKGRREELFVEI